MRTASHGAWPLPHWHPADVLHFPFRTLEQYERKTVRRAHSDSHIAQYVLGLRATEQGRTGDAFRGMGVDDDAFERGEANGSLVVDTRLRDALRQLHAPEGGAGIGGYRLRLEGEPPLAVAPGAAGDHPVIDAAAFREAETVGSSASSTTSGRASTRWRPIGGRASEGCHARCELVRTPLEADHLRLVRTAASTASPTSSRAVGGGRGSTPAPSARRRSRRRTSSTSRPVGEPALQFLVVHDDLVEVAALAPFRYRLPGSNEVATDVAPGAMPRGIPGASPPPAPSSGTEMQHLERVEVGERVAGQPPHRVDAL